MQTDHGEAKKKFAHKISIADGIDAILAYARKTEVAPDAFAIENNGRSGERSGAEWKNVCSRETITKAIRIALQGLHLPEQVMRKSDRLCALQVCVAGHYDINVSHGKIEQSNLQTCKRPATSATSAFT